LGQRGHWSWAVLGLCQCGVPLLERWSQYLSTFRGTGNKTPTPQTMSTWLQLSGNAYLPEEIFRNFLRVQEQSTGPLSPNFMFFPCILGWMSEPEVRRTVDCVCK